MSAKVSDLNRESWLQRLLRENALVGLMLVIVLVAMINGYVIGLGMATMNTQTREIQTLRTTVEVNNIYVGNLHAWIQAQGLEDPPAPPAHMAIEENEQ